MSDECAVDGAAVLDRVAAWISPYLAFPSEHCLPAVTLWAAHTHAPGAFYVSPRLVLDSAEPGSGKTRVLELLNLICHKPEMILSPTTAAIFRMLASGPMSLLFDEVDAIFNPKNGGNYEDLRALLNAGYKRGNTIPRCVGDAAKMKVERFKVFSPVALAGIAGNLPATITTRSITIHMRKRPVGQKVKSFRERDAEEEAKSVHHALSEWVSSQSDVLSTARPKMPEGVEDRAAECWEALLAIADAAGGDWPEKARAACEHFVLKATGGPQSLGVRLLRDLRTVFGGAERISTVGILEELLAMDESPWGDLWGQPLDARRLAKELGRYEVAPVPFKDGTKTVKGYTTYAVTTKENISAGLTDAWNRYLPPDESASRGNGGNQGNGPGQAAGARLPLSAAEVTEVTAEDQVTQVEVTGPPGVTALTSTVTPVTSVTQKSGCRVCGHPLDPALGAVATHPACEREENA